VRVRLVSPSTRAGLSPNCFAAPNTASPTEEDAYCNGGHGLPKIIGETVPRKAFQDHGPPLLVYIRADDERVPTSTARAVATAVPGLETPEGPFANLPEARAGRWGEGLTAAKMKNCRW
jgi:hypothetical protein